ncbi:hypothetical protein PN836_016690 [Ningiella sp. W23]|uniref:hypothetical protein n=1 Tax=Ningiella sp. W23 TaxID=3023715 RepID=UPI0037566693
MPKKTTSSVEPQEVEAPEPEAREAEYHIDVLIPGLITGWVCHNKEKEHASGTLTLSLNNNEVAKVTANMPREDLVEAGLGNGQHGFEASVNWQYFEVGANKLVLTLDGHTSVTHTFNMSQKQLMVAMQEHICMHIDDAMMQMQRNLLNALNRD